MQLQYGNLRAHIKNKIGLHKFYDAIPKLKLPQKQHTHISIESLMSSIKQGSASYRKIIARSHTRSDLHNPSKWRLKLNDNQITRAQLKQSKINLHSKYLSSDVSDTLTRFKLGKTLFGNQLYKCELSDHPFCKTCLRELDEEIPESILHATYDCMFASAIISDVQKTFFPQNNTTFSVGDILLANVENTHPLYTNKTGQLLSSLIWDFYLIYMLACRSKEKTPISTNCIHEIKSQINKVLKILPLSDLTKYINNSDALISIFNSTNL